MVFSFRWIPTSDPGSRICALFSLRTIGADAVHRIEIELELQVNQQAIAKQVNKSNEQEWLLVQF